MADLGAGISPGHAAWRRLRRNVLAMTGMVWVIVISLLCFAAPLVTEHDPRLELPWIGAQPAGFEHPDVLPRNRFIVGSAAETSPSLLAHVSSDGFIDFTVEETMWVDYRIALRRGKVRSIQKVLGAAFIDQLELPAGRAFEVLADGELGTEKVGTLVTGEQPAPGLLSDGQRVLIVRVAEGEPSVANWQVSIADGVVHSVARDSVAQEQLLVSGDDIQQVSVGGAEITRSHLLGTDAKGRDLWSRLLYGGRISLMVGFVATIVSIVIGVIYGALSGYLGGRTDRIMMSSVDILYGLPFMFLVILLLVAFGRDLVVLFVALGAVQWLTMSRIVRGQVLTLRSREFIAAARLCGASPWFLICRHLIPNCLGPIIVYTSLTVPVVILEESFLAFLGLTVEWDGQALDSWGALVWQGRAELGENGERSWLLLWPAAIMTITLLGLNALGDGLRDALDPQLKGRS